MIHFVAMYLRPLHSRRMVNGVSEKLFRMPCASPLSSHSEQIEVRWIFNFVRCVNSFTALLSSSHSAQQHSDTGAPDAVYVFSVRGHRRMLSGRTARHCGRRADKSTKRSDTIPAVQQNTHWCWHADSQTDGRTGTHGAPQGCGTLEKQHSIR